MHFPVALSAALSIGLAGLAAQPAKDPPIKIMPEEPFYIAGYAVRTSNAAEMGGNGEIAKLWRRFFAENLGAQIRDRAGESLIVVYSDYSSDEKGEYSYLLGRRVNSVEHLAAGMTYKKIAPGPYAVLTTAQGPLVEVLQAEWRKIWAMPPAELGGKRAFLTDYEVYDARSADPQHAQVEIHVGLKRAAD